MNAKNILEIRLKEKLKDFYIKQSMNTDERLSLSEVADKTSSDMAAILLYAMQFAGGDYSDTTSNTKIKSNPEDGITIIDSGDSYSLALSAEILKRVLFKGGLEFDTVFKSKDSSFNLQKETLEGVSFWKMLIGKIFAEYIESSNGKFTNITVDTLAKIGSLIATTITTDRIEALNGTVIDFMADRGSIDILVSNEASMLKATIEILKASDAVITRLSATEADIINLVSDRIKLRGAISSNVYLTGLTGVGYIINGDGDAELKSLTLREFLETPELRYNRVQAIESEFWCTERGITEEVTQLTETSYRLKIKLDEGDCHAFWVDDILKSIVNDEHGFRTMLFRVIDKDAGSTYIDVVPEKTTSVPRKFMTLVRQGNFTIKDRQRSIYISSKEGYIRFLDGVDSWRIAETNVKLQLGNLDKYVHPTFGDMTGYSAFLQDIFMTGRIFQTSSDGNTVKPVPVYKGEWVTGTKAYYYDEFSYQGSKWMCIASEFTLDPPAKDSVSWLLTIQKGYGSLNVTLVTDKGTATINGNINIKCTAIVTYEGVDISKVLPNRCFDWTRKSENIAGDTVWDSLHKGFGNTVTFTGDDVDRIAKFDCIIQLSAEDVKNYL